jgi:hypothetical protein
MFLSILNAHSLLTPIHPITMQGSHFRLFNTPFQSLMSPWINRSLQRTCIRAHWVGTNETCIRYLGCGRRCGKSSRGEKWRRKWKRLFVNAAMEFVAWSKKQLFPDWGWMGEIRHGR